MNRKDRRRFAKEHKGDQPFSTYFKTLVNDGTIEKPSTDKAHFCWLHRLQLENPQHPTDADKKKIDAIRLVPFKSVDPKTGVMTMGRSCPRCGNTVYVKPNQTPSATPGLEGYTTKEEPITLGA